MNDESLELVAVYLRLDPKDIAYVKFILESYEAVGFMRTVEPEEAVVVLYFVPDFAGDGEAIVGSLEREVGAERVSKPSQLGEDWLVKSLATP